MVERGDPDRFAATMAAPPAARAVLFPLYAFNIEVARAPWVASEPMIAEMRLQWWRDALEEIASGGPVRRHEVVTPLDDVLDAEGARLLDGLAAARRWECYRDPFEDEADFDRYIDATSGHLVWTAARLLGARDEAPLRDYAYATGVANWLRAIPELESR
ncbi:squalene/phytoene synthase family protein, partial [Escherichia coli]|nr:squalene/phytoene synthase family protein [Escherichia coli]